VQRTRQWIQSGRKTLASRQHQQRNHLHGGGEHLSLDSLSSVHVAIVYLLQQKRPPEIPVKI